MIIVPLNFYAVKVDELTEFAGSVTGVPYHPGAARYFSEHGISVPAA